MALTNEDKTSITEQVLNGKLFSKSPTSAALLRYLVNATLEGVDLKESTIGLDFLGERYESEKSNARIRVNIYNLRKKLQKYYETEGANDKWRISIEKGQYHPEFKINSVRKTGIGSKSYIIIGLCTLAVFCLLYLISTFVFPLKPALWKDFFSNKKRTTLFIGDVFGIMGTTVTGNYGWNRDYSINNLHELYALTETNPNLKDKITAANYNYITGMGAYATKALSKMYFKFNEDFSIRFTSNSNISDIKEGNSIYVGPIKNNNKFIELFNNASPYCSLSNDQITILHKEMAIDTSYNLTTEGLISELAIVARIPGPNNTEQFLFFSDHDIGVTACVELFSDIKSLRKFNADYLNNTMYFTAIFRARGLKRTSLELETLLVLEH